LKLRSTYGVMGGKGSAQVRIDGSKQAYLEYDLYDLKRGWSEKPLSVAKLVLDLPGNILVHSTLWEFGVQQHVANSIGIEGSVNICMEKIMYKSHDCLYILVNLQDNIAITMLNQHFSSIPSCIRVDQCSHTCLSDVIRSRLARVTWHRSRDACHSHQIANAIKQ
jgi:hypothetical protein